MGRFSSCACSSPLFVPGHFVIEERCGADVVVNLEKETYILYHSAANQGLARHPVQESVEIFEHTVLM